MKVALARHDAVLKEAVGNAGGAVVKLTGDGMLAVFETAEAAIQAAVAAQLALTSETWSTPEPLKVRMGLHAGEGEFRDGDYFGPAVNRAARIMAAAHGGQVLVSGMVADLVSIDPRGGLTLRDLGTHRLKDLTLPERLHQIVHPGLPDGFPVPATLEATPNNLPVQVSEFFGRESELASIRAMLASPGVRLLTLTGPGGAGKTRLGLQAAAEQLGDFPDGVFFVDLAPETDPDAAFEAVVRTLDFSPLGGGHPLGLLTGFLRDRRTLLLLDNFEQVTEAAVGLAELIQHCPDVKVIVTSREALRVRAEHVFPVPALGLPDPRWAVEEIAASESIRLFVERARNVSPGFSVTDDNAATLAEICLRLDGLPLAIELAAARLNVFTPSELMDRLRSRLDVLGAGGRDLPARQRTLWGAIGWSYELLESDERQIFEMMAVFSPVGLGSLERVAHEALGERDVVDTIASLVDKSLIRSEDVGGNSRFSMLQTMKEYALEKLALDPDRESRVRQAHAVHFTEVARRLGETLRGESRAASLETLDSLLGNLRTAWRYWVDLADLEQIFLLIDTLWALHDARGWYHSAIEMANDALEVLAVSDPSGEYSIEELTLRTSVARALMAVQGYTVEVEQAFRDILERASATGGSSAQRFPILRVLSSYYMNLTDFDRAAAIGRELLYLAEVEDNDSMRIDGHYVLGAGSAFGGDLEVGLAHLDRAIELYDPGLHPAGRFRLGPSLGVVANVASGMLLWQSGSLVRAITRVDTALDLARDLDHPISLAYGLYHHGLFQFYRHRFPSCLDRAVELRAVASEHGYPVWSTLADVLEGVALAGLGRAEEGLALIEHGVELYRGLTTPPIFWPLILGLRAFGFASAGNPRRGLELVDEAISVSGEATPELRLMRGQMLVLVDRAEEAAVEFQQAANGARAMGMTLFELQALTRLVELGPAAASAADRVDELANLVSRFSECRTEHDVAVAFDLLG